MTCTQAGTKLWPGASYMKYLLVIRDPWFNQNKNIRSITVLHIYKTFLINKASYIFFPRGFGNFCENSDMLLYWSNNFFKHKSQSYLHPPLVRWEFHPCHLIYLTKSNFVSIWEDNFSSCSSKFFVGFLLPLSYIC